MGFFLFENLKELQIEQLQKWGEIKYPNIECSCRQAMHLSPLFVAGLRNFLALMTLPAAELLGQAAS